MYSRTIGIEVDFDADDLRQKYSGVSVSIERIGPNEAADMLCDNQDNRRLNHRNIVFLADAIKQGEWFMNGEAIIYGADGLLLNGQHRLWAIIRAELSVDVMVVRGVDKQAFKTLDSGRTRRAGEVLDMAGESNGNQVASAIQALVCFADSGGKVLSGGSYRKATPATCQRILNRCPAIRESVRQMKRNGIVFNNQQSHALHFLFGLVNKRLSEQFASVMADGDADILRPFVLLRESLIRSPVRTETRSTYAAKAIKAFNAELSGNRPRLLKMAQNEEFPAIEGLDYAMLDALMS